MNNKLSPAIVCGFAAAVLTIIPGLKSFACCLIIPFAVYLAMIINQKINGLHKISPSEGIVVGIFTGLFAALFGTFLEVAITWITKSNDLVASYPEFEKSIHTLPAQEIFKESLRMIQDMIREISTQGFSLRYTSFLLIGNTFINVIFGMIGGLVSMAIINRKSSVQ